VNISDLPQQLLVNYSTGIGRELKKQNTPKLLFFTA
jgi:hypothetical protein